jgi:predicted  nucleic acid-binding Zn-ribbon protein
MQATSTQQQLLYNLQRIDRKAQRIRHDAETLPETAKLKGIIVQRRQILVETKKLENKSAGQDEIQKDIEAQRSKINDSLATLEKQLQGETRAKVVSAINQQKAADTARLAKLDEELEQSLAAQDDYRRDIEILTQNDRRLETTGNDVKNRREGILASLRTKMAKQRSRREICVQGLTPELVDMYTQLARSGDGDVVVRYLDGHLDSTTLPVTGADLDRIRTADPDEVVVLEDPAVMVVRF